ncbi:MAG: tRNA pseudouridine(55) synthase TruB [Clostridiales bacterium]|nr:tRNA pseudouridine(55) synthase TruB [Clostridiales bacterium]
MKRRDKPDIVSGVIIIDKDEGITSHRIVQILRKLYDTPRVGHTGTLDPLATGVLPVLVGRAVKASEFLLSNDKEYEAILQLGTTTDTQDITGEILSETDKIPDESAVRSVISTFIGDIMQMPPMYSAIKVGGIKLVDAARQGEIIERESRPIHIDSIDAEKLTDKTYKLKVACSKGTYIRTLCADIGEKLGCGGIMAALRRTRSGLYDLTHAHTIEELEAATIKERVSMVRPCESLFTDCPAIYVNDFQAKLIRGGTELYQWKLKTDFQLGTHVRIYQNDTFFALGEVREYPEKGSAVKPIRLFVL